MLWTTDLHLNWLKPGGSRAFGQHLAEENPDAPGMIVTGDISEAPTIVRHLTELADGFGKLIYFLCGNHDFYRGSIQGVHRALEELVDPNCSLRRDDDPNLAWLDAAAPILFKDFALVGQYSWYDGLNGNPTSTQVVLYDFESIAEFRKVYQDFEWVYMARHGSRTPLLKLLRDLAREATEAARFKLELALQMHQHVIFATHVAPFEGASWHQGKTSNAEWLPWFSCRQMGDMLAEIAVQYPDRKILVLCGHSHSPGVYQHAPNLRVLTGKAVYGAPDLAGLIDSTVFDRW